MEIRVLFTETPIVAIARVEIPDNVKMRSDDLVILLKNSVRHNIAGVFTNDDWNFEHGYIGYLHIDTESKTATFPLEEVYFKKLKTLVVDAQKNGFPEILIRAELLAVTNPFLEEEP